MQSMKHWFAPSALLALAACGSGQSTEESAAATGNVMLRDVSADVVAQQMAAARKFDPPQGGLWLQKIEVVSLDIKNATDEQRSAVEEQVGKVAREKRSCLTSEQLLASETGAMGGMANMCKFEKVEMAGGKLNSNFQCTTADGQSSGTMTGTSTANSQVFTTVTHSGMGDTDAVFDLTLRVTRRRLGDCES
ncbi:MAG: hypothetical protein CMN73_08900 [Sphingomonas sp.]|nr:hypothetical protein [Sphingomonas sp.]